jgi:multidrug efflux system membrane fusion protein
MKLKDAGVFCHQVGKPWGAGLFWLSLLFIAGSAGCGQPTTEHAAGRPVVPVTVATVAARDVPLEVTGIGNVEAYSVVSVKPQVTGQLLMAYFAQGQEVQKNALLFEIDPKVFQADLSRQQANLDRDKAQLKQAEANLARDVAQQRNAEVEARRYEQLLEKGIEPRDQYDQARTTAEALQASVKADQAAIENARQAIRADEADVENSRIQLGYCSIRAPIEGRTGSLLVQPGNVVSANTTAMVVINQVRPVNVNFSVPEHYLPQIREYMARGKVGVDVSVPGNSGGTERGALSFVNNAVDSATGTIQLKATFANDDRQLWPGQFVNVVVTLAVQPNAVVVPSQAVQTGQQGSYVFVVTPDLTAETRPVTTGRAVGSDTVIEKGLQPGERVVTDGQLRLVPGAKVELKEPLASPGANR